MIEVIDNGKCQNIGTPYPFEKQDLAEPQYVFGLIELFNGLFLVTHNTELVLGKDEPIYLPADETYPHHRVIFAHGFFSSAMHEIAHWCVAGPERRLREDFGYWYEPDGRSLEQQKAFEQVEIKPQAIEWILTKACGRKFRVSTDNLAIGVSGIEYDDSNFKRNIWLEVQRRFEEGFTDRMKLLSEALIERFQSGIVLDKSQFRLEDI